MLKDRDVARLLALLLMCYCCYCWGDCCLQQTEGRVPTLDKRSLSIRAHWWGDRAANREAVTTLTCLCGHASHQKCAQHHSNLQTLQTRCTKRHLGGAGTSTTAAGRQCWWKGPHNCMGAAAPSCKPARSRRRSGGATGCAKQVAAGVQLAVAHSPVPWPC